MTGPSSRRRVHETSARNQTSAKAETSAKDRQTRRAFGIPLRQALHRRPVRYAAAVLVPALVALCVVALRPGSQAPTHRGSAGQLLSQSGSLTRPSRVTDVDLQRRKPLTLITGNKVRLTPGPGGRSTVTAQPEISHGGSAGAYTFKVGGDVYSVPADAARYVGSLLDPRFFDVSYLQRAGYADMNAVPVSISWQHAKHSAVPGLSTPSTGRTTSGSVATSSATSFGRALSGYGKAGSAISQIKKISLGSDPAASSPLTAAAPAQMDIPPAVALSSSPAPAGTKLYTLSLNVLNVSGQPGTAFILIQNLKSMQRYYDVAFIDNGQLDVSVPAGPYGIEAVIYDNPASVYFGNVAFVPIAELDVTSDTTATLDGRQAKPVEVSVPTAVAPAIAAMTFSRASADHSTLEGIAFGLGQGISSSLVPPLHMFAKPTPAPRLGTLDFANSWELVPMDSGDSGVDAPYTYSLDFPSVHGVPTDLTYTLAQKDLATVHDSFAANVPNSKALTTVAPLHPWSTLAFGLWPAVFDFPVPTQRVDYFSGSTSTVWYVEYQRQPASGDQYPPAAIYAPYRTFKAGDDVSMTWDQSPSVPSPEWQSTGFNGSVGPLGLGKPNFVYGCPVCRQGDVMAFNVPQSGDNDLTHSESWEGLGSGILANTAGGPSDSLKFSRNGTLVETLNSSGQMLPMLPGKASYTIDWTSMPPAGEASMVTKTESVWTFTSARPSRADRLPAYELCTPDANHDCSFVPLVFASYDFGANLNDQVRAPGIETFTLTGYHQAHEPAPAITHASVQVSFDDGATWSPASRVTNLHDGRFRVSVNQPDPSSTSGFASVKVNLADAAGDTLQQTVIRAYALTGSTGTGSTPGTNK